MSILPQNEFWRLIGSLEFFVLCYIGIDRKDTKLFVLPLESISKFKRVLLLGKFL